MITAGTRYRFVENGELCCACPGMDSGGHPAGWHVRVGKGLAPFAFHQDCAQYEANKDRFTLVKYLTEAGVEINVIRIIGDGNGRTGGAYGLKPLAHPTTWESGQGVKHTMIFSPLSSADADWYANFELRGELSFEAKNEVSSCLLVAIRQDRIKVAWFRDSIDGDGGGTRFVQELPFAFKPKRWYELEVALKPDPFEEYTWDTNIALRDLKRPKNTVGFSPMSEQRPNRIKSIEFAGTGDEQQGLDSGLDYLLSKFEDEAI